MDEAKEKAALRVLLVDDEESILRALNRLMMDEDFEVLTACSGQEALDILKDTGNVGLIVSDQRMPGLSGADFLERARKIAPQALRIVLTGYADVKAAMDAINKGGAYRYITKPWDDDEIIQIIRDAVQRYSLSMENKRLNELVKRQNIELKEWNGKLKQRVLEQTANIRIKNEELLGVNRKLIKNFDDTISSFSGLIELRDKEVRDHSKSVADLAVNIAHELGISNEDIKTIRVASLLHDIGKIGINDIIMGKDIDDMSADELDEYMLHPVRGQAAIDGIEDLREAGVLIRHHHEWYDGSGFPDKCKGSETPLGSRIIAIADFIDRTVKKIQREDALELTFGQVYGNLGKKFDPDLFPLIKKLAAGTYHSRPLKENAVVEWGLYPQDLLPGMVVVRDVYSGTGLLLLSKGTRLEKATIKALKRYYEIDPPTKAVLVQLEG